MKLNLGLALLAAIFLLLTQAQTDHELAGTSWILKEYGAENAPQTVLENAPVTLVIDSEGQQVSGSASCNNYSGGLTVEGSSFLVDMPISTTKACMEPVMGQEQDFFTALSAITTFELSEGQLILSGSGQRLVFVADGSQSSTPSENSIGLENTAWTLKSLAGQPIAETTTITLEFRDGGLGGSAGCNSYRGNVTVDGNTLAVSPLNTTRRACDQPVMTQEMTYLRLLQSVTTFEQTDKTLTLLSREERLEFASAPSAE